MKNILRSTGLVLVLLGALLGMAVTAFAADLLVVEIDIKPCKDPNVLNIQEPGWLPVAILGDVAMSVDPDTVTLQGVAAYSWFWREGSLIFKFAAQEIIATFGEVENGDVLTLTLEGELIDGTPFVGYDEVVILRRGAH